MGFQAGGGGQVKRWYDCFFGDRASGLVLCLLLCCCADSKPTDEGFNVPQLELVQKLELAVSEPSGLALGDGGTVLWAVSNSPERVYKLGLDGRLLDTLAYRGEDLEGIVFDPEDANLWVVEEGRRELVKLDQQGNVLRRQKLPLDGGPNSGLEGITLDGEGDICLLNEKDPGLFLCLERDLSIGRQQQLDFASDYSGLTYDRRRDSFWVLSHEDSTLYLWDEARGVSGAYKTPFGKVEGVAVDGDKERLYIVSERDSELYIYTLGAP